MKTTKNTTKKGRAFGPAPLKMKVINDALLKNALFVLEEWLPGGKVKNGEYVVANPVRGEKSAGSFSINIKSGKYHDFGDKRVKGGDLIKLYRYLNRGTVAENFNALSKFVRENGLNKSTKNPPSSAGKKPAPKVVKKKAPPAEPIKPEEMKFSLPDTDADLNPVEQAYEYRNEQGEIVFYRCRIKLDDEGGKKVIPLILTERFGWKWKEPQGPHPLYRCDKIDKDTVVLFGEGEKVADHLNQFPGCVGVTSAGGSGALLNSDLSSLEKAKEVIIFPDGDDPGAKYAAQVAAYCAIYKRPARILNVEALKWTDGKDAADEPTLKMEDYEKHFLSFDDWIDLSKTNRRIADTAFYQIAGAMDDAEYGRQKKKVAAWLGGIDLRSLNKNVESHRPVIVKESEDAEDVEEEMTPEEIEAARAEIYSRIKHIAKAPNILELVQDTIHKMGVVGEEGITSLTYLAVSSRLLDKPINPLIKGTSASGKSLITQTTLKMFPEGAYYTLTGGSARSLIYTQEDFSHRMLVILEASQLNGADENDPYSMFLRTLISEGRIRYETTVKGDDGKYETEVIEKEGPTGLILTTTADHIHPENETRMLSAFPNESDDQTKAIIKRHAEKYANPDQEGALEKMLEEWHAYHDWISMGNHKVTIPFMTKIAAAIGKVPVRFRRDFSQLGSLIETSAILHQDTRTTNADGRLIATLDDYKIAREVILLSLQVSSEELISPREKAILDYVVSQMKTEGVEDGKTLKITTTAIAKGTGVSQPTVSRWVHKLVEAGYLFNAETLPKKPLRLKTGHAYDSLKRDEDNEILPTVEQML